MELNIDTHERFKLSKASSFSGSVILSIGEDLSCLVDDDTTGGDESGSSLTSGQSNLGPGRWKTSYTPWTIMVLLMGAATIAAPAITFHALRKEQLIAFRSEFHSLSDTVASSFSTRLSHVAGAANSFSVAVTSQAQDENTTWPYFTMRDFDLVGESAASMSGGFQISYYPIVQPDQRESWEEYALESADLVWKNMARHYGFADPSNVPSKDAIGEQLGSVFPQPPVNEELEVSSGVFSRIVEFDYGIGKYKPTDTDGPIMPTWASFPLSPWNLNFNLRSVENQRLAVDEAIRTKTAVVSRSESFLSNPVFSDFLTSYIQLQTGDSSKVYQGEPVSGFQYPIFDSFDVDSRSIVATYSVSVIWPLFFRDSLPEGSGPVHGVMESTCEDLFSFSIDGSDVEFDGYGALHGNQLENVYSLKDLDKTNSQSTDALSVPLSHEYCPFELRLYPSGDLRRRYLTVSPWIVSAAVASTFIFLVATMLSYRCVVKRRIRLIFKHADENYHQLASLFPKKVLERLIESRRQEGAGAKNRKLETAKQHSSRSIGADLDGLRKIEHNDSVADDLGNERELQNQIRNPELIPIADLYNQCTVSFSEINGFNSWQLQHEPEDIFILLEAVFGIMDRLAKNRGVFKVETISDEYLAVAGIPNAAKDHATRMARFASDCMQEVQSYLKDRVGPNNLSLKMGIHSGQITAGVLRVERARFQLFGDTVNFASRMKSTGIKGRVQVSEDTAKLLTESGKGLWLEPRNKTIQVKGKGEASTFWLRRLKPSAGESRPKTMRSLSDSSDSSLEIVADSSYQVRLKG